MENESEENLWRCASADEGFAGETVFLAIEELKRRGFAEELKRRGFRYI